LTPHHQHHHHNTKVDGVGRRRRHKLEGSAGGSSSSGGDDSASRIDLHVPSNLLIVPTAAAVVGFALGMRREGGKRACGSWRRMRIASLRRCRDG
jgi:hypothetical protein